jgi:hypothetical protein
VKIALGMLMAAMALPGAERPPLAGAVEEIERTASSEPPVLGIDTQIRAARVLAGRDREAAERMLRASGSRIFALAHQATRTGLLKEWLAAGLVLDRDGAEMTLRAWLDGLPERGLGFEDRAPLLNLAESVKEVFPELSQAIRGRAASVPETDPERPPAVAKPGLFGFKHPIPEGSSVEETVSRARREKNPVVALDLLLMVVDEEEDARRRGVLLSEALDLTERVDDPVERLLAQSMLTRRLYESGDRPRAAVGAQMLAGTFEKMYHCGAEPCDRFTGGENPGEAIHVFAEYLKEHGIAPEALGLSHPSLRVRLLLLEVEAGGA